MSKKIAYLGPQNSYSQLAAQKIANKDDVLVSHLTFLDVLNSVQSGDSDIAVVPVENSTEGLVSEVTDGLIFDVAKSDSKNQLYINFEFTMAIDNFLITKKGADFNCIKTVITHPQPYGQCRHTIKKLLPNAKIVYADSTSSALAAIKDNKTASIGGKQLADKKFIASDKSINDAPNNSTRFVVLSKSAVGAVINRPEGCGAGDLLEAKLNSNPSPPQKFTIVFEAQNKPGGLVEVLQILANASLNLTRLESRPHKTQLGRYVFLCDILGNYNSSVTQSAISNLKDKTLFYKYLGSY